MSLTSKKEQELVALLKENARQSPDELATMLGIKTSEVSSAIHRLEKRGIILKYTTVFNEQIYPTQHSIRALIEVCIRPEKKKGFDGIAKRICKYPNVIDHYLISGDYDFLVIVEGDSLQEISAFVSDKLASIENVRSTRTHFILKKYKEHGVLFDSERPVERLAVSP
jgi:DNA-binding Lrp family transcriptional regulator